VERALETERQRARTLARQAQDLKDLIAKLEHAKGDAAGRASSSHSAPSARDLVRMTPAMAFADAKGKLRLPVNGIRIKEFGSVDQLGNPHRGLSIATRAGAQVTAPSDGWVVYAGPFRSYGQLLILNAGGGYHILLAGMERISVDLGQFVLNGEPVATMGGGAKAASALAIGSSQPVLYIEFRKDGSPIDPGPWWAVNDSKKVRG
jgi:septal ring factor EnvC (AmiA/AmiB activator)